MFMDEGEKPLARQLVPVALLLASLSVVASLVSWESWRASGVTIIWPSNGFMIAVLLCVPKRQWTPYLVVAALVDFCLNLVLGNHLGKATYFAGCNTLEVWLASWLLFPRIAPRPDLTVRDQLRALVLYGMLLAPAVTAALASFASSNGHLLSRSQLLEFQTWCTADSLGVATMTPLYLSFRFRRGYTKRSWGEVSAIFLLLMVVTFLVFWQTRVPLLFLILPFLLLLGLRLGLAASALGLLLVAIVGGMLTTLGRGPVMLIPNTSLSMRDLTFQFFIAVSMLVLYTLEVVIAESNRLQLNLRASESRFRLLAESSRDVIVMTALEGERHYVSPAVAEVLGWQPEEMVGGSFRQTVHPDDAPLFAQLLQDCREGKPTVALAYRCRTKSGEYRWLETNPRLYRDPVNGKPAGIVSVVRDISDRKLAEQELDKAFRMVENLASIDGLTGIANRRRFDETLDREWRRAQREGTELSLILLDVDHFKAFNDLYGHLRGDDCLRQIAESIREVATYVADLPARYGGEEFAVILPHTGRKGAIKVSEEILSVVRNRGIVHEGNPHGVITVSAGCVTFVPVESLSWLAMLQAVDAALYRAKAAGRNRIEVAEMDARVNQGL
jgi:diguanylate cyclase (GGDEF)-like protein/PAS domain S-box-containing protein